MKRAVLCAVLVACKGTSAPPEDKRAPAQAPVVADAPPDAPASPCFAVPGMDAERAGIRKLTVQGLSPMPRASQLPGVTKLVKGKPVRVPRLKPPQDGSPFRVVDIGVDAIAATAKVTPRGVELIAPSHATAVVVRVQGETNALVAVEDAGLVSLIRYRESYVPSRRSAAKHANETITTIEPLAIFPADLGAEPAALVSYSEISDGMKTHVEVGMLWHPSGSLTPQIAFATIAATALPLYFVPPTLSGGKALLVGLDGTRLVLDQMKLTALPAQTPGACLQTSPSEPATWRP